MHLISTQQRAIRTINIANIESYLALIGLITIALLAPGPAIVATIQTSFMRGRKDALPFSIGLAVGASLWCMFALAGLSLLFTAYPQFFLAIKVLGGIYILWIACNLWASATAPLPGPAGNQTGRSFWGGILLNLSNPKPSLFYAVLIVKLFPGLLSLSQNISIYATALATELFWYVIITLAMSTAIMRRYYFNARFWIDRTAAVVLSVLGFLLVFTTSESSVTY